jgi:hypothetical protein
MVDGNYFIAYSFPNLIHGNEIVKIKFPGERAGKINPKEPPLKAVLLRNIQILFY